MYLLDTNICIFAINKNPPKLIEKIKAQSASRIYISSLTVAELEFGVQNSQKAESNRLALLRFLAIFDILNFDSSDAVDYGQLKVRLRKRGQIIGPIDMLLAAQALNKDMIFVTNNVDEFSRIDGLPIEDWSK
ncbi:MAG: twitching motility protein PilT [Candidatus Riflebacteria bacterium GWC2_50_8]|nr:MAG: twitching motility protein PilT [Candidatus Riflebacteria bacterium GWC2_50_8]